MLYLGPLIVLAVGVYLVVAAHRVRREQDRRIERILERAAGERKELLGYQDTLLERLAAAKGHATPAPLRPSEEFVGAFAGIDLAPETTYPADEPGL